MFHSVTNYYSLTKTGAALSCIALLFAVGCSNQATTESNIDQTSTPASNIVQPSAPVEKAGTDGLRTMFAKLQEAIRTNDTTASAKMTKGLFPDEASLQKAVKDPAAVAAIQTMHNEFSNASDEQLATLFAADPTQTKILVHAATTEELIAYEEGSAAFKEFPGGAKSAAESVLQAGMTFYEVALVEPGEDRGMKYHLFYHNGQKWQMLGPIWRVL